MRTRIGSDKYMATESRGLYRTSGGAYTKEVDIWAIGVLAHELFTVIVPFGYLDSYPERPSSGLDNEIKDPITGVLYYRNMSKGQTIRQTPSAAQNIKMDLLELGRYYTTRISFPRKVLDEASAPYSLIDFITYILNPNPYLRLSVSKALQHPWSKGIDMLDPSTAVGRSGITFP